MLPIKKGRLKQEKGNLLIIFNTHTHLYISNIQSISEDSGCELFVYRIYEEFHINLCVCSMYGYCYISFSFQIYVTELTYRAYTVQLEGNSNLVKLSLQIYFTREYHTLCLLRWLYMFNFKLKNSKCGLQSICIWKKKRGKTHINSKFSG